MPEYLVVRTIVWPDSPEIRNLRVHSKEKSKLIADLKVRVLGSEYHVIER